MEKLNDQNFHDKISGKTVLVDFFATWCGPCRMMHPVLEELESSRGTTTIAQVDVDESPNVAKEYGVMSIPTLILFKDGREVSKKIGFVPLEELNKWMSENE